MSQFSGTERCGSIHTSGCWGREGSGGIRWDKWRPLSLSPEDKLDRGRHRVWDRMRQQESKRERIMARTVSEKRRREAGRGSGSGRVKRTHPAETPGRDSGCHCAYNSISLPWRKGNDRSFYGQLHSTHSKERNQILSKDSKSDTWCILKNVKN